MKPLVSVIIPVFNVAPYLEEALDSVVHQNYNNLEIIIIDDGSTDGSREICDKYAEKDKRIVMLHQKHQGLSASRNAGLDIANGEYLMFVDSDDAVYPDMIKTMLSYMYDNNADVVVSRYKIIDSNSKLQKKEPRQLLPSLASGKYNEKDIMQALAEGSFDVSVCHKLFKVELWKKIRFPVGHVYEDISIVWDLFSQKMVVCVIPEFFYVYRKRQGSITTTVSLQNCKDWLAAHKGFLEYIEQHNPVFFSDAQLEKTRNRYLKTIISLYFRCNHKDRELFRKLIIETEHVFRIRERGFHLKFVWYMICYCPWLLRMCYSAHQFLRRRVQINSWFYNIIRQ